MSLLASFVFTKSKEVSLLVRFMLAKSRTILSARAILLAKFLAYFVLVKEKRKVYPFFEELCSSNPSVVYFGKRAFRAEGRDL
jgi:hypothetical protein